MIYVINIFFILPLLLRSHSLQPLKHLYNFYLFIYLVLFHGTFFEIGGDWLSYQNIYANPSSYSLDLVYKYIVLASKLFFSTNLAVNFLVALIFTIALFRLSYNSKDLFVMLSWNLSYLFPVVLIGYTRQALAIGFIYLLIGLLGDSQKRRLVKKSIYFLASLGSHSSSGFILLVIGFLRSRLIFVIVVLSLYFYKDELFQIILTYLKYGSASAGFYMRTLANFLVLTVCWYILPKSSIERKICIIFIIFIFIWWLICSFIPATVLFDRLNIYITAILTYILRCCSETLRKGSSKKWWVFAAATWLFSLGLISMWILYATHSSYWLPYKNVILEVL